jgi:membrane protease YdiL (CAAX protease family)
MTVQDATAPLGTTLALPRLGRSVEMVGLFVAVPLAVRWLPLPIPRLAVLLLVTAGCLAVLWRDPSFEWRRALRLGPLREALPGIVARAALVAGLVLALSALLRARGLLEPTSLGGWRWLVGLCAYPFVSALPQELLYRVFFFHRYRELLGPRALLGANAVAFGLLHVVYPNLLAPLLSVPAGLVLALLYQRTRALGPVWLEHTLYGAALFTLGLGGAFGASAG